MFLKYFRGRSIFCPTRGVIFFIMYTIMKYTLFARYRDVKISTDAGHLLYTDFLIVASVYLDLFNHRRCLPLIS